MKTILRKIYNSGIKRMLPDSFRMWLKQKDSVCYPIIKNPEEVFEKVYHIKDATWETTEMPEVWNMSKRYTFSMYHPSQDILKMDNACIYNNSDVVVTSEGVSWDKFYLPMFSYMHVMDSYLTSYNNETISIRKSKKMIQVKGACISMLGVFADIWSHFLVQFLPKLYYAESAGLLDSDITIILPDYKDDHVKELVKNVLQNHPKCKTISVPNVSDGRVEYKCDLLYWIPTASALSNEYVFPSMYHIVIPQCVENILHKRVFDTYPIETNAKHYDKIYLVRRGGIRNLTNLDEVESFFRERGFVFIEPHKMSLVQKIAIFRKAKIIAGPHSSAWSNTICCKGAKGLMLTPISWLVDAYVGYHTTSKECKITMIPGIEKDYDNNYNHYDYFVSMNSLSEAYDKLLQE